MSGSEWRVGTGLFVVALLSSSCESTTQIGSECPDGVCPQAALAAQSCFVTQTVAELAVTRIDNDEPYLGAICLPRHLPADEGGRVACRVHFVLGEGVSDPGIDDEGQPVIPPPPPESCSEIPFATAGGDGPASSVCRVAQVTPGTDAGGAEGWSYDEQAREQCGEGAAIRFTQAAAPPSGVTVKAACATIETVARDGERAPAEASECPALAQGPVDDVGAACLPSVAPAAGAFDDREIHLEVGSDQCDSGACLVYRLRGDPDPECDDSGPVPCAPPGEVQARAHCSCRCDAPGGGEVPPCQCGDGFSCVAILEDGPSGLGGSYCLRDGTF